MSRQSVLRIKESRFVACRSSMLGDGSSLRTLFRWGVRNYVESILVGFRDHGGFYCWCWKRILSGRICYFKAKLCPE